MNQEASRFMARAEFTNRLGRLKSIGPRHEQQRPFIFFFEDRQGLYIRKDESDHKSNSLVGPATA